MGHLSGINAIVGLVLITGAAWAGEAGGERGDVCTLTAVVSGHKPADRTVHAGPDAGAPVLTQIERFYTVGRERFYPEVEVTGSENGWFRIARAMTDIYIVETPIRVLFAGEGWIDGNNLSLWVEGASLQSGPSWDSAVAFDFSAMHSDTQEGDNFALDRLVACQGHWVEVEGRYAGQIVRGWTDDVCSSQLTTCP